MKDWLDMNRREFVAALAAAYGAGAYALGAPRSRFLEYAGVDGKEPVESFVNTLCPMCPGGCGLTVRLVHGCAVGVRGNRSHPINRGGLCSRACAALQDLYNPDRLRQPVQRSRTGGAAQWNPVAWEQALSTIAEKLQSLRAAPGPQSVCVVVGRNRGLVRKAWQRFMRAYGSPNLIDAFPDDNLGVQPAVLATHGSTTRIGYDVARANFVLSFSSAWLDAHWSTEQAARAFAEFRRGRPGFRPKWIHAEPRYSLTAAKADEWLPLRPATEGTLALGIAHVLIREGLYDGEFVRHWSHGFEDWTDAEGRAHLGFRRMVLQEFSPGKVQEVTGVSEGDIFRVAREFGSNRPALALGYDGGGCAVPATYDRMAVHCLNALVGSIDVPGGVTVFRELALLDEDLAADETAVRGLAAPRLDGSLKDHRLNEHAVDLLADAILDSRPYRPQAVILVDADPVFELAEGSRLGDALAEVPFVVACTGYHSDSSRHADLVLPLPHGLSRWDFDVAHTLTGHPVVTLSRPAVPPDDGVLAPYEFLHRLAGRMGGGLEQALPWPDSRRAVEDVCRELFERAQGAPFGPANEEGWTRMLETRGWRAPFAKDLETFQRDVLDGGGWTDPIYFHGEWDRVFRSPARKFSFSSNYLWRSFEAVPDDADRLDPKHRCLPYCPIAAGPAKPERFPLDLYVYALPNLVSVTAPNLPWLNDIAGSYMFEKWRTWVEVHPSTAARYGVKDHDQVVVRTRRGRLTLRVKLFAGLRPDVIAIPFGFGRQAGGRWCAGIGDNPAAVVDAETDPLTGRSLWTGTPAAIERVMG